MIPLYARISFILAFLVTTSSYGQIAAGKCKFLGNIISSNAPSDFKTYWNQVTPENSGKWISVEATRDVMNWTQLDIAYNYAKTNNMPFKQHTFVWGNQQPTWIENLSAAEQLAEIEEWIQAYCERYPDTQFIDVVNEPLHDPPTGSGNGNYSAALGGAGTTGWDWVIKSFELARKHCPDAGLILNEYNIINDNNKTIQYKNIVTLLKDRGLIDGIGVQGHRFELENATESTLVNNLNSLGNTGLPVYISEFDLGNLNNTGTPNDAQQRELYEKIFPVLWTHSAVRGITLWGYRQGEMWMETAYLKRTNGTPRSAFTWLQNYVADAPGGAFCYTSAEEDEAELVVYPNPADGGQITITSPKPIQNITLIDVNGRELNNFNINNATSADLVITAGPGMYLLRVHGRDKSFSRKIVIR